MEPQVFDGSRLLGGDGQVINTQGSAFDLLLANDLDENVLRPFIGSDGRSYIQRRVGFDLRTGKSKYKLMLTNAPATLTKDAWIELDQEVLRVQKERMAAWNALVGVGGVRRVADPMGTPIIQYQTMTDITGATRSMDGMRRSERDRPTYDLGGFPLPIIHKDLGFSLRDIATSRRTGQGIDNTTILLAIERVAEDVEKLTIGVGGSFSYATYPIYGYANHPNRVTVSITLPLTGGVSNPAWSPQVAKNNVLAMKQALIDRYHYGPYDLYFGTAWGQFLDDDYSEAYPSGTLRTRLQQIDGITNIRVLDYLPGFQMLLVERSPTTARAVIGMRIRAVQWDQEGGFEKRIKVMCMQAPQVRADASGNCGVAHGA